MKNKISAETRKLNMAIMKVIEDSSVDDAVNAIENPELDRDELASLLQDSIDGAFVDSSSEEKVSLSNSVFMGGVRNLFKRIVESKGE